MDDSFVRRDPRVAYQQTLRESVSHRLLPRRTHVQGGEDGESSAGGEELRVGRVVVCCKGRRVRRAGGWRGVRTESEEEERKVEEDEEEEQSARRPVRSDGEDDAAPE